MSQAELILWHLEKRGSITPVEALNEIGCFRLAARINDLRRTGVPITTEWVERNGKRWAKYRLAEPTQAELF
jgi:hypothetical protein